MRKLIDEKVEKALWTDKRTDELNSLTLESIRN